MALWKVTKYAAIAIGVLVLISVVISAVAAIVGIVWTILTAVATLLVLAGLGYATIQGIRWLRSDGDSTTNATSVDTRSDDPVERLSDRYVAGELSEDEFERRLSLELDGADDEIERELHRS